MTRVDFDFLHAVAAKHADGPEDEEDIDGEYSTSNESDIAIVVKGDISESFKGYTVVLDYDETKLQYASFEEPPNFRGLATFTLCPDEKGSGCSGIATAKMVFGQSKGVKSDGIVLGTFHFKPKAVTASTCLPGS